MDGQHALYRVKITVRRDGGEPETFEYASARVTARPGRGLVIRSRWRILRRYRAGQWAGYDVELVYDRRRAIRRRAPGRRQGDR